MIRERLGEGMTHLWGYLFGDGPEDEVRELEDERLRDSRERRRQARMLLAERKEEDAAHRLRRGQVGLLDAMGTPTDEILSEAAAYPGGRGEGENEGG